MKVVVSIYEFGVDTLEKTVMLGKIEGKRRRGWQRMRWLGGLTDSVDTSLTILPEIVKDPETWHAAVHGICKESDMTEQQQPIKSIVGISNTLQYVCVEPIPPMKNDYGFLKELTIVFSKQVNFCSSWSNVT